MGGHGADRRREEAEAAVEGAGEGDGEGDGEEQWKRRRGVVSTQVRILSQV